MSEDKQLTIDYLEEVADDFKEQKEIFVEIPTKAGIEKVGLTIDRYFSPTKINLCVRELITNIDTLRTYLKDLDDVDELFQSWLVMLMIKHFSSLEISSNFLKQVAILDKLVETTVLFQVFANFNTNEIEKVMKELESVTTNAIFNFEHFKDVYAKVEQDHKLNKEIIKEIIEGK